MKKVPGIAAGIIFIFVMLMALVPTAQAAGKTVGVIMAGDIEYYQAMHRAFMEGIAGAGAEVVLQTPSPEPMSWANAARKLVALGADVIVAYGAPVTLTAMKVTSDIPIVFAGVYSPEAMNVTGKNATGISSTIPVGDVVRDLKAIKSFTSLGVIFNKSEKDTILQAQEIKKLESELGFKTVLFSADSGMKKEEIKGVDAIILTASCAGMRCISDVTGMARRDRIPTASVIGGGERHGVILTVAADPGEQGREAANMAKMLLKGASVSNMPIMNPRKIDKIVNVREAAAMGITVRPEVLRTATRIIE